MKEKYFWFIFCFFGTFSVMSLIYNQYIYWGLSYSMFISLALTAKQVPYWIEEDYAFESKSEGATK